MERSDIKAGLVISAAVWRYPPRVRIDKTSADALVFRFGNLVKLVCAYVDKTKPVVLVLSSPRLNGIRKGLKGRAIPTPSISFSNIFPHPTILAL